MAYSFSQLDTYQQCPRKRQYRYLDKIVPEQKELTADLVLGQSVHATLEKLYNAVNNFYVWTKKQTLDAFRDQRAYEVGQAQQSGKTVVVKGEKTIEDFIRRGNAYIERYYDTWAPFDQSKVVATESHVTFSLDLADSDAPKFRGVIDRLDKEGDMFVINDYKTNQKLPPMDKDVYRDQMTLYALGIKQKYGKYFGGIKAKIHYLHFMLVDERIITDENIAAVVAKYRPLIEELQHTQFAKNMGDNDAFVPKDNMFCKYCDYMSICPLRAHAGRADESLGDMSEMTVKKIVDEYAELSRAMRLQEAQKDMLKKMIADYMHDKHIQRVFGETDQITASVLHNVSIKNPDVAKDILAKHGVLDKALTIDRFAVKKLVDDGTLSPKDLGDAMAYTESLSLRVGKKKE